MLMPINAQGSLRTAVDGDRGMNYVSLFSGISADGVAWRPLGWRPLAFAEIESFARAVLARHHPDVPNLGDVTQADWSKYAGVDLVMFSPPCQSFSIAGLRGSLSDDRGNLTLQSLKAIHAIDPRWTVFENVPGIFSADGNPFGCLLAGLVGGGEPIVPRTCSGRWSRAGVVCGPGRAAAWRVLDAQYVAPPGHRAAAQRRERVFVISRNFRDLGDLATGEPRRDADRVCGLLASLLFERERLPRNHPPCRKAWEYVAGSITGGFGKRGADVPDTTHTMTAEGFNASEDGTGRGTPLIAMAVDEYNASIGDVAGTVAGGGRKDRVGACLIEPLPFDPTQITSRQNRSSPQPGDPCHTIARVAHAPAISFQTRIARGYAVRRLTPTEVERLFGFPDGYTRIPYRGKAAKDAPRYRALGNSIAVPVLRWIGWRIARAECGGAA